MIDFTWDAQTQAYHVRHKLSNGQYCQVAFYRNISGRTITYYVSFAVADKKKNLNGWFNETGDNTLTMKFTGRCGCEALLWCRDRILDFSQWVGKDQSYTTKISVFADDGRRFHLYERGLSRYGFQKVRTFFGWAMEKIIE